PKPATMRSRCRRASRSDCAGCHASSGCEAERTSSRLRCGPSAISRSSRVSRWPCPPCRAHGLCRGSSRGSGEVRRDQVLRVLHDALHGGEIEELTRIEGVSCSLMALEIERVSELDVARGKVREVLPRDVLFRF